MSLFSAIGKLTKAAIGTAMIPVDVARDAVGVVTESWPAHAETRMRKVKKKIISKV